MNRWKLLAALTALMLVLAACGGDDDDGNGEAAQTVSAEEYAASICTALSDWQQTIVERSGEISTALQPGSSPEEGVEVLRDFMADVIAETETLVAAIDEAGVPDVEGGEEFASQLRTEIDNAQSALERAAEQVEELPTDSPQAFSAAAQEVGAELNSSVSQAGDALTQIDVPELDEAFTEEEACANLGA